MPVHLLLCITCAALLLLPGCSMAQPSDDDAVTVDREVMQRYQIDQAAHPEAVCNDGTTPVFYHRPGVGAGADRWVIWFKGGGSCWDAATCAERGPSLTSGAHWMQERLRVLRPKGNEDSADGKAGGILDPDPAVNPDFHDWNHVYLVYCTSDHWAGTATREIGGRTFAFHGHHVVDAMFDALQDADILDGPTLAEATQILLTGSSAGANGLRNNLDRLADQLAFADVRGVADAALIPREAPEFEEMDAATQQQRYALWQPQLDASCVAATPEAPELCQRGVHLLEHDHLSTPLFHHQDQRDFKYLEPLDRNDPDDRRLVRETAAAIRDLLATQSGAFSPNAGFHIILNDPRFNRLTVNGHTMAEVLGNWTFARPGPTNVIEDDASDTATDGSCSETSPAACHYRPAATYATGLDTVTVIDTERAAGPRRIPLAIRYPKDAEGPRPVVLWSHGGARGHRNPVSSGAEWGEVFARAGYVSVHLAHRPRDRASREALCRHLGAATQADCQTFKYLNYDRPHDVRRVLDYLEEIAKRPPFQHRLDLDRIAMAGHSAGAGATMMLAGAERTYFGTPTVLDDARLRAFLAFSPQGPGEEQFHEQSWDHIDRPMLLATGAGDVTSGSTPENRRAPFTLMPPGDKYLLYLDHPGARHTLFNLKDRQCLDDAAPTTCRVMLDGLRTTALAFLDAYLLDRPAAHTWLASRQITTGTTGIAEWRQR
ncbi:MAG: hypothetical protein GVY18_08380 [Bacteroidetes bacterium]|jgi:predicted dienelactone hydrolase|nr:hypothetical protein [Bacteroidota bacterium]